jgi:hypothetical protein
MTSSILKNRVAQMQRRMLALAAGAGAGWAIAGAALALVACMAMDLLVELPGGLRAACDVAALLAGCVLLAVIFARQVGRGFRSSAVRRLDEASLAHGQIVSAVDLAAPASTAAAAAPVTAGLAQIAIARAERLAQTARPEQALPIAPLYRPLNILLPLTIVLVLIAIGWPRLVRTQMLRFAEPFGDHPPYSPIVFNVQPGNTQVAYGGSITIEAALEGGLVGEMEALVRSNDVDDTPSSEPQRIPMFQDRIGHWQATIADVRWPMHYSLHARRARSESFAVSVLTVPQIQEVRFRITPPPYTHRPAYEGPMPQGGIAGLPGTHVQFWAKSNRPLVGGAFDVAAIRAESDPASTQPAATTSGALAAVAPNANEATGSFTVSAAGQLSLHVKDIDGQTSTDTFTAPIALLHDERPTVRLMEPRATSFATPDVTIEAVIAAEDDYGLSRLQLFHDVNESAAASHEVALPRPEPTRYPASVPLDLSKLKLKPGDLLRVYARAEDNDPAGAKGSETPIATVRIISQKDMERLQLAQEGMEVLQSKYEQANRRLEAIDQKIQDLQKELAKLDPSSELAQEKRDEIQRLADEMDRQAAEVDKTAKEDLPFDLDQALKQNLGKVASNMRDAAKQSRKLAAQPGVSVAVADKELARIREKLGGAKQDFDQQATDPIEHLAQIFPLKEDEARFIQLAEQQRDLAERMRLLQQSGGDPNTPANRDRMRDLEDEQRQRREDLKKLLDDIDQHVAQLPADDAKLDELRNTARQFASAVRTSGADEQMTGAEQALGERNAQTAHARSSEAADTLDKFLSHCQNMGNSAGTCLKFQPQLAQALGNTVEQLLNAEGLGNKPGQSTGTGSGGGYSARRNSMNNVGIYGNLPTRSSAAASSRGGKHSRGVSADGSGLPDASNDPFTVGADGQQRIAGEAAAAVPPQYKKRVGEYFQRVADELGEQKTPKP